MHGQNRRWGGLFVNAVIQTARTECSPADISEAEGVVYHSSQEKNLRQVETLITVYLGCAASAQIVVCDSDFFFFFVEEPKLQKWELPVESLFNWLKLRHGASIAKQLSG